MDDIHESLQTIADLLAAREEDFDSLRQMQLEWLQFQSTLERLIQLLDGHGRPPISERLLLLEEHARRLNQVCTELDSMKLRLIGLLIGLIVSLLGTLFTGLR